MRICFSAPWLAGWLEARAVFVAVERNDVIAVRIAVLHGGFAHAAFVARAGPGTAAHFGQQLIEVARVGGRIVCREGQQRDVRGDEDQFVFGYETQVIPEPRDLFW